MKIVRGIITKLCGEITDKQEALDFINNAIEMNLEGQIFDDNPVIGGEGLVYKNHLVGNVTLDEKLFDDREIVDAILAKGIYIFGNTFKLAKHYPEDVNVAKFIVSVADDDTVLDLYPFNGTIRDNEEVIHYAIVQNHSGFPLFDASPRLQNDYDIVMLAVENDEEAFEDLFGEDFSYISDNNFSAIKYASEEMKNNPEIMLEAVKHNPFALYYAGPDINKNKEIVETALKGLIKKDIQVNGKTTIYKEIYNFLLEQVSSEIKTNVEEDMKQFERDEKVEQVPLLFAQIAELQRKNEELDLQIQSILESMSTKGVEDARTR